jgi:CelD/BcsL family acetyltransferase involved in cellulose biosynthesis
VAQALAGTLWGELGPQWDLLNLHEIPAASPVLYHLLNLIEEQGRQIDVPAGAYCPAFRLPEAIDGVVGGLGTRHREAYRRNLRAVHRAGRVEHLTWRGRDVGQQIRPVLRLHEARWPEHDKRLYPFVLELLEAPAGEIGAQLDCLLIDGEPCAGYLHFDTGSRRELYLLGVDRERHPEINVGKALLGGCLERAVGDGVKEYDFLKGGESYKFDWANTAHRSLRAEAPRRRAGTVLSWCVTQAKALGRILVR